MPAAKPQEPEEEFQRVSKKEYKTVNNARFIRFLGRFVKIKRRIGWNLAFFCLCFKCFAKT